MTRVPFGRAYRAAILLLGVGLSLSAATAPQAQEVPQSREQITLSYAPLVRKAAPAVVNIYTKRVVRQRMSPLLDDPFFRQFFGDAMGAGVPRSRVEASLGSGVIVRADGLVVTNDHVIKDSDEITVVLADRREFAAKVVLADERVDLAVLRIDAGGEKLPTLALRDSDDAQVGDLVLAIGNPFGVGQTVTSGIVSALARTAVGVSDFNFFIQTDAAINPGNSGGALVTMDGRLVGINSAIYSRTGGSVGIGFAIPANMVRTIVDAAANGGKLVRPWLGGDGQAVTQEMAASLGLARPQGVLISQVRAGSPLDRAGVKVGDVVTTIEDRAVDDWESLRYRVATLHVGGTAPLKVVRKGQDQTLSLPLTAPQEEPARDKTTLQGRQPLAGAVVANINPALIEEKGLPAAADGVVVLDVGGGSIAQSLGVQPGDIVVKINDRPIARVADLRQAVAGSAARWTLAIRRGGQILTTTVGG